ncbi:aminotransferase class V-fold PLP-dependent enzyme [Actinoplanes couchii]|uniref:Cysteine desulfurase-like protein n=1 Tax=Actinoplanes couchii TaxID=403638 RepID=A0ABQ3XE92_9ACTN|nr:aminotransferase class V-fold PLP-dependent enzyme [Actinoplanes couchii]MDR6317238.1 cysteine desulfurase family protein (TIGR01976 family) [Actinoplanes couchii]GID56730.1 cysteine desulfurase-like protein [Actinoplanes couchii]
MSFDVTAFRAHFPSLDSGLAFFDGPGGTQTPRPVAEAIVATMTGPLSNRGAVSASERNADRAVTEFRAAYADLLGVPANGIVHGRSATQLTYDFSRHLARTWQPGDEIVVSRLDHDSNIRPWVQAAASRGVTVRWIEIDPFTTELELSDLSPFSPRTRLVAVTAASNVLGTVTPLRKIADMAHAVGALLYVDGVHYTAHRFVDVSALGADFFVCSPYKFLGPHCGVLAADPALLETLRPDKLIPSSDSVPERFEFGTLPYEQLAGATAAVDFLAAAVPSSPAVSSPSASASSATSSSPGTSSSSLASPTSFSGAAVAGRRQRLATSFAALHSHEGALRARIENGLPAVTLHSLAADRTPTLLMSFEGRDARDAQLFLAARDVLAPAGSFYAQEPFAALKLPTPALRVGLAPYNTVEEVDRLLEGLAAFSTGS